MMSNNKILTVSYGTFSCTLEGFDDSFDTMKAIAEYFRDLASDDRYFGAEPPQPDADMLARIAEHEIARRVEAHARAGGIHLRADESTDAPAPTDAAPDPQAPTPPVDAADDTSSTRREPAPYSMPDDDGTAPVAQASTEVLPASIGYGIRAVMDPVRSPSTTNATAAEPVADPDLAEPRAGDLAGASSTADQPDPVEPVVAPHQAPTRTPGPDSVADKLQRIRAVVSRSHRTANAFCEDEHAAPILDSQAADGLHSIAEFFAQGTATAAQAREPIVRQTAPRTAEQDPDAATAGAEAEAETFGMTSDASGSADLGGTDPASEEPITQAEDSHGIELSQAGHDDMVEEDPDAATGSPQAGATDTPSGGAENPDITNDEVLRLVQDETQENAVSTSLADDADTAAAQGPTLRSGDDPNSTSRPVRARVIKVKRSEIEAAVQAGLLEGTASGMDEIRAENAAPDNDFDGDGDLIRRLSQPQPIAGDESITEESRTDMSGAGLPEKTDADSEVELDRLMTEADQHLNQPDATGRRAAFGNLRGAVDATRSDDELCAKDDADSQDYRTDLAAAVTPRRPVAGIAGRSDRPRDQRPAPLKLVAEQRIDVPTARSGPVRPRRVAATPHAAEDDDNSSFADYAAARGAHDLPDLLEAAAAYLSFVEGHEAFTRPQLMTKVRQIDPDNFNREDGLRQFGHLIRSGKIEKIKGGRFTVSDDIGFRPDGERVAG